MSHHNHLKGITLHRNNSQPEGLTHLGGSFWSALVEGVFLATALLLMVLWAKSPWVRTLTVTFVAIVLEAFPFMLIGSLVGGMIEEFVPRDRIATFLPQGKKRSVFIAASIGVFFPVCECGIVPVVRRLLSKGAPASAAVAFLLGGPIVNPIVFGSTAVAYQLDWGIAIIRLGAGYLIAVVIGLIAGACLKKDGVLIGDGYTVLDDHSHHEEGHHTEGHLWSRGIFALQHAAVDFFDMVRFLIIGAFFAALIQSVVDRSLFFALAENPWLAILAMMGLAILLNLCSEADAFVAATFRFSIPLSGQMAFMVLGPMFDLKLLIMYLGVFRKKAILILVPLVLLTVFVIMILTDHFLVSGMR